MNYSDRTSIILTEQYLPVGRSFLNEDERKIILEAILEKEKNDKDSNFISNNISDNLKGHERTDWYLHEDESFKHTFDIIKNILNETTLSMSTYPSIHESFDQVTYEIVMLDSWFARSKQNAHTSPHHHGCMTGLYAFSCYLSLPSKNTSLTFARNDMGYQKTIHAREGDILVFPSSLYHWSFGLEEERCILSGNYLLSLNLAKCEECD